MKKLITLLLIAILIGTSATSSLGQISNGSTFNGVTYSNSVYKNLYGGLDVKKHWARDSIYKMAALGVIHSQKNRFYPNSPVSREQAISMLLIFAGKQAEAEAQATGTPVAFGNRGAWAEGYLNYALANGIITTAELNQMNWTESARREEIAYWLAKVVGYAPVYGQEQQGVYGFQDWNQFDRVKIPYCEPVIANQIMQGKNGKFNPKNLITRGELCATLERALPTIIPLRNYSILQGTVIEVGRKTSASSGNPARTTIYVMGSDGKGFSLISDYQQKPQTDFLVLKKGTPGKSVRLAQGDNISVLLNEKGQVVWADVKGTSSPGMEGTVEEVNIEERTMDVNIPGKGTYTYPLAGNYKVISNGYLGNLADLVSGQKVSLKLNAASEVTEVNVKVVYPVPGGYPQGFKQVHGTLVAKSELKINVKDDSGSLKSYNITSATVIQRQGTRIAWWELEPGEYLKMNLVSGSETDLETVEVTPLSNAVTGIYKGKIKMVDSESNRLTLTDIKRYENKEFNAYDDYAIIPVQSGAPLFAEGNSIGMAALGKGYKDSQCYFVTSSTYGQESISRLTIQGGSEFREDSKIIDVKTGMNQITINAYAKVIGIDTGTIVVRNKQVIDAAALNKGDLGVFYLNGIGTQPKARLIALEEASSRTLKIYHGSIDSVGGSILKINDVYELSSNQWQQGGSVQVTYSDDTGILDGSGMGAAPPPTVSPVRINRSTLNTTGLTGAYDDCDVDVAALYDSGTGTSVAIAINISPKDYYDFKSIPHNIATGDISKLGTSNAIPQPATFSNYKVWDSISEQWVSVSSLADVEMGTAVIMKRGAVIGYKDLSVGDSLYLVTNGGYGILAIVQ
ncbi:MAG: S-layer homology domain-containing protein [Chitinophagales bacterium]